MFKDYTTREQRLHRSSDDVEISYSLNTAWKVAIVMVGIAILAGIVNHFNPTL